MRKAERTRRIDQHDIERTPDPTVLKSIVKYDNVCTVGFLCDLRRSNAIRGANTDNARTTPANQAFLIVRLTFRSPVTT
jgi:hypothetical protein